jgi:hypothetical protein
MCVGKHVTSPTKGPNLYIKNITIFWVIKNYIIYKHPEIQLQSKQYTENEAHLMKVLVGK